MNLKSIVMNIIEEGLVPLNEVVGLNRVLSKYYEAGFIIMTSYRFENESSVNKKTFDELKKTVRSNKYGFVPVWGGFIENYGQENQIEVKEPALIVPNIAVGTDKPYPEDHLKELGIQLCQKYNQDSFLYKPTGKSNDAYYITKTGQVDMKFNSKSINDLTQQYFTQLSKGKKSKKNSFDKNDKRFTFSENLYLSQPPKGLSEAQLRYGEYFFSNDFITKK